jgi:hypothetical protein
MGRRHAIISTLTLAAGLAFPLSALAMEGPGMRLRPNAEEARLLPFGEEWQRRGSGNTSFLGLRLYHATLWTAGAAPQDAAGVLAGSHALTLRYVRDFSRDTLVEASLREMKRLGATEAELLRWKHDLARVFPNVKAGEVITGLHRPGRGATFLHQGQPTGEVADPEFARRFFGIWLDPKTRDPELRAQLFAVPDPAATR